MISDSLRNPEHLKSLFNGPNSEELKWQTNEAEEWTVDGGDKLTSESWQHVSESVYTPIRSMTAEQFSWHNEPAIRVTVMWSMENTK